MAPAQADSSVNALAKDLAAKVSLKAAPAAAPAASKPVPGKKPLTAKELKKAAKKAAKKEERSRLANESRQITTTLNAARFEDDQTTPRNHLASFAAFANFKRDGLEAELHFYARDTKEGVPSSIMEQCFKMTEANMAASYEECGWGWNPLKKQRELESEEARLLVALDKSQEDKVLGFLHYRFEREEDQLVLYVYEVQVDQVACARKGLGRHLMLLSELMARRTGMDWICLTVINCNEAAVKFYDKLGFKIDATSPQYDQMDGEEDPPYTILSKRCKKPEA